MRRRLLLTTDAVGGVWTYSLDLARALAEAEDLVTILAVVGPSPDAEQLTEAAAVPGLQLIETDLPLDWTASAEAEVREAAEALARLADAADVDLVQLHSPAFAVANYPAPVVSVAHSCVATWWDAVRGDPLPEDLQWRSELVREGLSRSTSIVAPTSAFARDVQRVHGLSSLPLAVHNSRSGVGTASDDFADFALTAGRLWDAGKNVAAFDRAAALSSVRFEAAGHTQSPDGSDVTLSHAVALGRLAVADLSAKLAAKPVFVSTTLYEPFGLAVLEAAQAGCALVLSDRPGFRELWDDAALFVDANDEHAIAAAVDRLIADRTLRAELGKAAQSRAARFTPAATATAMQQVYNELCARPEKVAA